MLFQNIYIINFQMHTISKYVVQRHEQCVGLNLYNSRTVAVMASDKHRDDIEKVVDTSHDSTFTPIHRNSTSHEDLNICVLTVLTVSCIAQVTLPIQYLMNATNPCNYMQ